MCFWQHLNTVTPSQNAEVQLLEPVDDTTNAGLCPSGKHFLRQPLQLPCGHHMCASCIRCAVKMTNSLQCAECKAQHSYFTEGTLFSSFRPAQWAVSQMSHLRRGSEDKAHQHTHWKWLFAACWYACHSSLNKTLDKATKQAWRKSGFKLSP